MDRTNRYATEKLLAKDVKYHWYPTTVIEIMALHAVIIYMSIVQRQGGLSSYWETTGFPDAWVPTIFTAFQFKVLFRMLHVASLPQDMEAGDDPKDPTLKVRVMYRMAIVCVKEVWSLAQDVCIDEGNILGASRRCPIRQLNLAKPIPAGTKCYVAVDGAGICYYYMPYCGRRGVDEPEKHLTVKVINDILDETPTHGHDFVADNWYGSYQALENIKAAGHSSLLMMKRPKALTANSPLHDTSAIHKLGQIVTEKSVRGASCAFYLEKDGETRAMLEAWRDNKVVVLLTDRFQGGTEGEAVVRRAKDVKDGVLVPCTEAVKAYNKLKSLVDRFNFERTSCNLKTAPRRWWMRVFLNGPLAMAEINSWHAAVFMKARKLSLRDWCQELALQLVMPHVALKPRMLVQVAPVVAKTAHLCVKAPASDHCAACVVCPKHSHCGYMCSQCQLPCHQACFVLLQHLKC